MNTFYTAFDVLKNYIKNKGLEIVNFSLIRNSPCRVVIWVSDNTQGITHFVCVQMSPTQFCIWGYGENYQQIEATSFDYADVNTPQLEK